MIKITKAQKTQEKKYTVATVAKATGKSEGSISAYFSNRKVGTKNGITIDQIAEYIEYAMKHQRGEIIKWDDVSEIRGILEEKYGIIVEETEE